MEKLDVLYTVNDKYIDIMLGSIISLILNSNIKELRLHIIASDFKIEDYHKIEDVLLKYSGVELYFYDIKTFNIEKFKIPNWRGTQIANARLFFQDILHKNISSMENLLYLDSDTIVVSDLNSLVKYKSNAINAVKDSCYKNYFEILGGLSNYFNSGVLFFNVVEWINRNYQDKIVQFLENCNLVLRFPDQDILNCSLDGNINMLSLNYNMGANTYLFGPTFQKFYYNNMTNISNEEIIEAKKDPKILHTTGVIGIKPWMNNNVNPFNEEFMKYILKANPEFEKNDIGLLKKLLSISPLIFKVLLLSKNYVPESVRDIVRKLTF